MEDDYIVVKSYTNVWKIHRTFYSIGGVDLPTPVSTNLLIYALLLEIPMHFFGGVFPIPVLVRYVLIPFGGAWLLDQYKLDGKSPFHFIRSIVTHFYVVIMNGRRINRYKHYRLDHQPVIKKYISYRVHQKIEQEE